MTENVDNVENVEPVNPMDATLTPAVPDVAITLEQAQAVIDAAKPSNPIPPVEPDKDLPDVDADEVSAMLSQIKETNRLQAKEMAFNKVADNVGKEHLDSAMAFASEFYNEDELMVMEKHIQNGGIMGESILLKISQDYQTSEAYETADARLKGKVRVGNTTINRMNKADLAHELNEARRVGNGTEVKRLLDIGRAQFGE